VTRFRWTVTKEEYGWAYRVYVPVDQLVQYDGGYDTAEEAKQEAADWMDDHRDWVSEAPAF
jgi:hypothetical protein